MDKFDPTKPEWVQEPKPLDFKVVNQPLEEVAAHMLLHLEREQGRHHFLLKGLLTTSFQSYRAICKLVVNDPKYPAQAHILGRSLMDALFTISALAEKPAEYSRLFELAGYRVMWEEYEREFKRYQNEPGWEMDLHQKKDFLDSVAEQFCLSQDEITNPSKHIKYWPIPSQLLKSKMLCHARQIFLEEVYFWRYGQSSEWSHQAWGGMAMGLFATMTEQHWQPGKFESDAVYTGILFLLMIISEIEALCKYGFKQKLRYIWTTLNYYFEESADYYRLRYDELLQEIDVI